VGGHSGGHRGLRKGGSDRRGVDTDALSSKTMECLKVKGLFFIGEVVDVTVIWADSISNGRGRRVPRLAARYETNKGSRRLRSYEALASA